ncbi:MAG: ankyrin repeat domain-containing protein [Ferruginibacter sp.]
MRKSLTKYLLGGFLVLIFSCEYFHTNPVKQVEIYSGKYLDLMIAAKNEDLDKMENIALSNHLNLNYADSKEGVSLLNWCALTRKQKSFEKLLSLGADPNWQDKNGKMAPPITEVAALEVSTFLELCLKYKGDPNILLIKESESNYETPLYAAVTAGFPYPTENLNNLKILIKAGADVNLTPDTIHGTPFIQALIGERIEMARYLIDHGADYTDSKFRTIDGDKLSVLDFLRDLDFPLGSYKYKIKMGIVDLLQAKGMNYWNYPIPAVINENHKGDSKFLSAY